MSTPTDRKPPVEVVLCPDGPALVRSTVSPVDVVIPTDASASTRPVSALCRCGRTGRDPWCDGTHKLAGRRRRPAEPASGKDET